MFQQFLYYILGHVVRRIVKEMLPNMLVKEMNDDRHYMVVLPESLAEHDVEVLVEFIRNRKSPANVLFVQSDHVSLIEM